MEEASSMPSTIGSLRARVIDLPVLIRWSENTPPSTPPAKPHSAGMDATMPTFRIDIPFSCTR
ncbi:hypothetical protein D3C86_2044080 [compost metagenome]